jgi:hypothetical protein
VESGIVEESGIVVEQETGVESGIEVVRETGAEPAIEVARAHEIAVRALARRTAAAGRVEEAEIGWAAAMFRRPAQAAKARSAAVVAA